MPQNPEENRIRRHAHERFDEPERLLDLHDCVEQLRQEPVKPTNGHRQITLSQDGSMTMLLFDFEEGGTMNDHSVDGVAHILCLHGELQVETDDGEYNLEAHQLLVLTSGIKHRVEAQAPSQMLLTVMLQRDRERSDRGPRG